MIGHSVKLVCPCGEPLELFRHEGQFVIGHLEKSCSPFVRSADGSAVLNTLLEQGGLPTAAEHIEKMLRISDAPYHPVPRTVLDSFASQGK